MADMVPLHTTSCDNLDLGSNPVSIASSALQGKLDPVVAISAVIDPYFRGGAEGGDYQVELAVTVKISNR